MAAEGDATVPLQDDAKNHLIVELKKKALAAKQAGETAEALERLKDSKRVAAASTLQDLAPSSTLQCSYLRSLASIRKAQQDIPGALAALKQAKEIEAAQAAEEDVLKELEGGEEELVEESTSEIVFTDEEMMDQETMAEMQMVGMDVPSQETYLARIVALKKKALALKKQNNVAGATAALRTAKQLQQVMGVLAKGAASNTMDDLDGWGDNLTAEESALLGELVGSSGGGGEVDDSILAGLDGDDENDVDLNTMKQTMNWQDLETLEDSDITEFMEMGIVDLPSVASLLEMAENCQKEAVTFKQDKNIAMAKAKLVESKKIKLQATRLDKICKQAASSGQDGGGGGETVVTEEDLEALMSSDGDGAPSYLPKATETPKPVNPWTLKPSADIKAEVLRLKNAKKVKEATALLKILKQVVKKENDAKEAEKKQAMVARIQREVDLCQGQLQLYSFYEAFVDPQTGSAQNSLWQQYQQQCERAIHVIESEGSSAIKMAHPKASGLVTIQSASNDAELENWAFVSLMIEQGTKVGCLEGKMEAAIVQAFQLHDNKTIQKLVKRKRKERGIKGPQVVDVEPEIYRKIQVDVKVQLPPGLEAETPPPTSDEAPNDGALPQWTTFSFLPLNGPLNDDGSEEKTNKPATANSTVRFIDSSKKLWLPRGNTTKERSLIRRMERKKVEFHLNYNPNIVEKPKGEEKGSWFWSKKEKKEPVEELPISHLGKVVLELKYLLYRNCVAGDFPLVVNNKPVGGFARLGLRTDAPLDPAQFTPLEEAMSEITKIQTYKRQLVFSKTTAAEF